MNRSILSICANPAINFLLETNLSKKCLFLPVKDVVHGLHHLKKQEDIELIIIDVDYDMEQNIDFIHHINSSGFYQMPMIILATDEKVKAVLSATEDNPLEVVLKPFSPVDLLKIIDRTMAHGLLQD